MANWESLNLPDILPAEVLTIASDATSVASDVAAVLNTLADIVADLAALIIDFTDPLTAIVSAIISDINDFITDLINTDVFLLVQIPPEGKSGVLPVAGGMSGFERQLTESFYDQGDPNRPVFSSSADVGGVVLIFGSPNFPDFADLADKFTNIFGFKEFEDMTNIKNLPTRSPFSGGIISKIVGASPSGFAQITDVNLSLTNDAHEGDQLVLLSGDNRGRSFAIATNTSDSFFMAEDTEGVAVGDTFRVDVGVGQSMKPDWKKIGVSDTVSGLAGILDQMNVLKDILQPVSAASQIFGNFAAGIQAKATAISNFATALNTAVDDFEALLTGTGISILNIPEQSGGVEGFLREVQTAGSKPPLDENDFAAGITIFAGPGASAALGVIF